jgi:hypothetical protein
MTPHAFLNLLWQHKPEELYVLLWTLQDKRSHWFRDVGKAGDFAANANGHDVYVGVGLSKADHGSSRRCPSEEIAGIGSLWTDLDLRSEAHTKPLPGSIPEALSILPPSMPPSIVISTGNGIHPWWLLKEPHVFDSDEERTDTARLIARWHSLLRLNAAARGWSYDRLSDLARVLRIPGTLNHKDPARPKGVTVLSVSDRRYNLSDFEELLDDAGIPDQEAQEKAAREWAGKFADTTLVVNTNTRIPREVYTSVGRIHSSPLRAPRSPSTVPAPESNLRRPTGWTSRSGPGPAPTGSRCWCTARSRTTTPPFRRAIGGRPHRGFWGRCHWCWRAGHKTGPSLVARGRRLRQRLWPD